VPVVFHLAWQHDLHLLSVVQSEICVLTYSFC
jgi:hypothetical protein